MHQLHRGSHGLATILKRELQITLDQSGASRWAWSAGRQLWNLWNLWISWRRGASSFSSKSWPNTWGMEEKGMSACHKTQLKRSKKYVHMRGKAKRK